MGFFSLKESSVGNEHRRRPKVPTGDVLRSKKDAGFGSTKAKSTFGKYFLDKEDS